MSVDYFDERLLCKPGIRYYIGVRHKSDPEDIIQPIGSNNNPTHHDSLKEAMKMAKQWAAENPQMEVRIYKMTIVEDKKGRI